MKNHILLIIAIFIIFLSSCNYRCKDCIVITPKIQYDVPIINNNPEQDWWVKNIEGPERELFLKKLYEGVASGKLKTFDINNWNELSIDKALQILKGNSDIQTNLKNINKLRFFEKWIINKKTSEYFKKVIALCPIVLKDTSDIPLFWIKFDTSQSFQQLPKKQNFLKVSQRIQYDVSIINNSNKTEWWIDNLETTGRTKLIDIIFTAAYSGKSRLFDYFNEPINPVKLKKELNPVDTFTTRVPNQDKDTTMIIHKVIDNNELKKIRFMEEWYLDDKTYNFYKIVVGINLLKEIREPSGALRGNQPLFWIYFDKKYPIRKSDN